MVYWVQSKGHNPSLIYLLQSGAAWCVIVLPCVDLSPRTGSSFAAAPLFISPAQMQGLAFICWISWGSRQPVSLARRNSLYSRKLIHEYFVTDCVLENAISDRVCYSPSLSVHLSLPTRFKSLILIFLSCRFSHQAFLMPFRHSAHTMNNSYSLYYSGPWHWYIGNTIFVLFTSFSALISFVLDM